MFTNEYLHDQCLGIPFDSHPSRLQNTADPLYTCQWCRSSLRLLLVAHNWTLNHLHVLSYLEGHCKTLLRLQQKTSEACQFPRVEVRGELLQCVQRSVLGWTNSNNSKKRNQPTNNKKPSMHQRFILNPVIIHKSCFWLFTTIWNVVLWNGCEKIRYAC